MADGMSLDDRLAMLVLDALAGDEAERDLLIRCAEDPDALDDAERADLEARLAASPELVLQLELLRRMAREEADAAGAPTRHETGRTVRDGGR
jgi:hypothetical protein